MDTKLWFKGKHEARPHVQHAEYDPGLDTQKVNEIALRENAHIANVYYPLESGHVVRGTYLRRIGRRDNERCWECSSPA